MVVMPEIGLLQFLRAARFALGARTGAQRITEEEDTERWTGMYFRSRYFR
jgi:hypothetical protein